MRLVVFLAILPIVAVAQEDPQGWTLREVPGSSPVALGGGTGAIRSLALFCLADQPWLALTFADPPASDTVEVEFGFSAETVSAAARREESAGGAYVVGLADQPLASLLAGRDSRAELSIEGVTQGVLSLSGSTRAIRGALESCQAF